MCNLPPDSRSFLTQVRLVRIRRVGADARESADMLGASETVSRSWRRGALLAVATCLAVPVSAERAAADGAFRVEDADSGTPGSCKVESWGSGADNRDSNFVTAPSCWFNFGRPVELGAELSRSRDGGEMGTELGLKGKTQLFESGKFSAALAVDTAFDLLTGRHSAVATVVPFTYEHSEQLKFNLNAGWSWDRIDDRHFFTWGASVEFKPIDKITLIAEVFGEVGPRTRTLVFEEDGPFIEVGPRAKWPGFQAGLRYTPLPAFDIDFIYGRNITGVDANWFTLGLNVRFDAVERKNGRNGRKDDD